MDARDYQIAALASVERDWETLVSTLAEFATGMGKTYLATMAHERRRHLGMTMFFCHRKELVWQAVNQFKKVMGEFPDVEMGEYRAALNPISGRLPGVVVTTVQTQYSGNGGEGRMLRFDPKKVATIIVDEGHHFVQGRFKEVVDYYRRGNPLVRILVLTATSDRLDKKSMGIICDSVACKYDLRYGIDNGWLVPVDQYTGILTDMDLSQVKATATGDLNPDQLAKVLEQKKNLFAMVDQALPRIGDRTALWFASSCLHCELLAAIINDRCKSAGAEYVAAGKEINTPEDVRTDIFKRFYAGKFQHLVNVGIATEGFDHPGIGVVVCGRPTTSRMLYAQMAGRGTRVLPGVVDRWDNADDRRVAIAESAKPCCELIDFVGNAGKHKLITAVDLLAGDMDPEVVARVKKKSEGVKIDVDEELRAEHKRLHEERRAAAAAEAEALATLRFNSNCIFEAVDPFDHAGVNSNTRRKAAPQERGSPATEGQRNFLRGNVPKDVKIDKLTIGQAGALISEVKRRRDNNWATLGMAQVLRKAGLPHEIPYDTAKAWIRQLEKNQWFVPPGVQREASLYDGEAS